MGLRFSSLLLALGVVVMPLVIAGPAMAQSADARWVMPRTADGHPDLQGNWTNETLTPMARPRGQDLVMASDAAAQGEKRNADIATFLARPSDPNRTAPPVGGDGSTGAAGGVGGYNYFYLARGDNYAVFNGEIRSSLIVDPPDGQRPPLSEEGQRRTRERRAFQRQFDEYDNPENRPLAERCLMSFGSNAGPPMLPNYFYNNNYTIVQTADHVMIMTEMVHDTRIIRLGTPEPLPAHMRPWMGDSRGRWQGDTLVVETTNINPKQTVAGYPPVAFDPSESIKVTERFTRADEHTINYEFTVEDPTMLSGSFSGEVPFTALEGQVYEYSCHEGNYALEGVLSGARALARGNN